MRTARGRRSRGAEHERRLGWHFYPHLGDRNPLRDAFRQSRAVSCHYRLQNRPAIPRRRVNRRCGMRGRNDTRHLCSVFRRSQMRSGGTKEPAVGLCRDRAFISGVAVGWRGAFGTAGQGRSRLGRGWGHRDGIHIGPRREHFPLGNIRERGPHGNRSHADHVPRFPGAHRAMVPTVRPAMPAGRKIAEEGALRGAGHIRPARQLRAIAPVGRKRLLPVERPFLADGARATVVVS